MWEERGWGQQERQVGGKDPIKCPAGPCGTAVLTACVMLGLASCYSSTPRDPPLHTFTMLPRIPLL